MAQTKVKPELIDGGLGTDWQSTIYTSNFTSESGKGYFVNTTSGSVTISLPAGVVGAEIVIQDYAGTFATNKVLLSANGSEKIQGGTIQGQITTNNATAKLIYQDATKGWTSQDIGLVPQTTTAEYMLIGGGASGGGGSSGGGGGAGGLHTGSHTFSINDSITISIGGGASTRHSSSQYGVDGSDSTITGAFSATAGGGKGNTTAQHGGNTGTGSSGYPVKSGGTNYNHGSNAYLDGGGAGLGADGGDGSSSNSTHGASGGIGTASFSAWGIATNTGEDVGGTHYYGGGGGAMGWHRTSAMGGSNTCGSVWDCSTGKGGSGGGGDGMPYLESNSTNIAAMNGAANTGGGAGAGTIASNGIGQGGSGICIIRYSGAVAATGGTIVASGGYTYHTFTLGGTFTKT